MAIDKAVDSAQLEADLTAVADAIRAKTGSTATMTLDEMPGAIAGIETGGGGFTLEDLATGKEPSGEIVLDGVTIRNSAFRNCTGITKVTATNCQLLEAAFRGCSELTYAELSGSGGNQGYMLTDCTALTSAKISVTGTGSGWFWNCTALERADMGADFRYIGVYFCVNCQNLRALILRRTTALVTFAHANAMNNSSIVSGSGYVYVPDELVESYKAATNWAAYADQIKPLSELPEEASE